MFTGLVEEIGTVISITPKETGARLKVTANKVLQDVKKGDSISVSGCCLTVVEYSPVDFHVDVVQETMQRTNLNDLKEGTEVNLERALTPLTRIGGHFVQGHVDGVGKIEKRDTMADGSILILFSLPENLTRYIVEKGSICVDGVSLTVVSVDAKCFSIAMIPHTAQETTLGSKIVGSSVNIEVDILAKYARKNYE